MKNFILIKRESEDGCEHKSQKYRSDKFGVTSFQKKHMSKIHQCESMILAEAWIEAVQGEFRLNLNRIATEEDLEENHDLEEIGQTIGHVAINILYCPYCGEKLIEGSKGFVPSFVYNDFSNW